MPSSASRHFKTSFVIALIALISSGAQPANAASEVSRSLQVGVTVARSCSISTEGGASGAKLDEGCPAYAKQSLVREITLSYKPKIETGSASSEQLVLVINF